MSTLAAVMTGKGTGAISTVQLYGEQAEQVLRRIFTPTQPAASFEPGKIVLGTINQQGQAIDQVTVGCEGRLLFSIHCHGNPLIVEMIMELLQQSGAQLVPAEQLIAASAQAQPDLTAIEIEARITLPKAKTLTGAKIIAHQAGPGLLAHARSWLQRGDCLSLDHIVRQAERILRDSRKAAMIIRGCTAVLAGPPNSGKSTLLNCLAGRPKAIVTDVKGTTRDWVQAEISVEPLALTLIDTAGLDAPRTEIPDHAVEQSAHEKALAATETADIVLLVLDINEPPPALSQQLLDRIKGKPTLTVLNKADLPEQIDISSLPTGLRRTVRISARLATGIDALLDQIKQLCGVADFNFTTPVCFTERQEGLLKRLTNTSAPAQARAIITQLLTAPLPV